MHSPRRLHAGAGARLPLPLLLLLLLLAVFLMPAVDGFRLTSSPVSARRRPLPWAGVMGRPRAPAATAAVRMAAREQEEGFAPQKQQQRPKQQRLIQQQRQEHTRRAALGLALGPLAMAVGAGSASAAASAAGLGGDAGAASAVSAHKSAAEVRFELMKLGLDLTHAFKFEEAEAVYTELIAAFGTPLMLSDREKGLLAKAYSNRGNARYNLNKLNEAVVDYSLAIELNPLQYEYWTNRGLAFESMAEDLLEREAADNAGQDGGGGRASHQLYEAAVENYQHAMVLDPENHRLYSNAGDVLTHLGRHDGALEYYRQALMLNPVSPALGGKVALLEIETGNVERGTYLLESLVHRHPEFSEMVLANGAVDWCLGRFTDGIDKYSYAVERDPRLLDDKYLERERHWPPTMMQMVHKIRDAGTIEGVRSTAVSYFESRGTLI